MPGSHEKFPCVNQGYKNHQKLNQSNILPEDIPECAVVTDRITEDSNDIQIIVKNKKIPNHYSICWYRLRKGLFKFLSNSPSSTKNH